MVQLMLAQMIDWGTLDLPPGANNLDRDPNREGSRAGEMECDRKLQKLKDVVAEVEMINGAFSESSDDETQGSTFSLKPGAEEADNALEARDETEDLDDGAGENSRHQGHRVKGARRPTDLAIRDFQSLSEDELLIIEVCDRDVTSTFRIFGIKMKFSDKVQTLRFPDYEPHKHETKYLKDRWSMEAWDEFLGVVQVKKSGTKGHRGTTSKRISSEAGAYGSGSDPSARESKVLDFVFPWVQMFEDRSKEFYFHRVRDLSKGVLRGIREYLESLEEHTGGRWYILHWFTISMEDGRAKELHLWRRKCRETLVRNFLILVQRLEKIDKFPKTLWYKPGLWILPNTICYWIFEDPSVNFRTVSGVADLRTELLELDEREPARTLWADAASETARLEHVSEAFVSKRLLPKIERARNLLPIPGPPSTSKPRTTKELYQLRLAQDAASAGSISD
ncbi:hypothetical protein PHMEG_00030869 [Phytophthora megakarya]|uniref:Uncharacterized protein n=1 Tax=Phytophthora megakarya TaxID=4795 RepID=A0A225UZG3_9STRA|nr:hypothetical protein PHMEG_00030869 [Phytophthora megakarya]